MLGPVRPMPSPVAVGGISPSSRPPTSRAAGRAAAPPPLPPLPASLGGETRFVPKGAVSQRAPVRETGSPAALCAAADTRPVTAPPATTSATKATDVCTELVPLSGILVGEDAWVASGEVASIMVAAKARKGRQKEAVRGHPDGSAWVEMSELSANARRAVRSWARGDMSGRQLLLWLRRCCCISRLLDQARARGGLVKAAEEETRRAEGGLWLAGCHALGVGENSGGLELVAAELEYKSPSEVLLDAWNTVEGECGASAEKLSTDEVNLTFRRLSERAQGGGRKACAPDRFLQVQVWRELVRLHMGSDSPGEDDAGGGGDEKDCQGDGLTSLRPAGRGAPISVDLPVLYRLSCTDAELSKEAAALSIARLRSETAKTEEYVIQLLIFGNRLRSALAEWSNFDPYRFLGVSRDATMAEVRRAFFKRALKDHPDKGGDKETFQELQKAYDEICAAKGGQKGVESERDDPDEEARRRQEDEEEDRRWEQWFQDQKRRNEEAKRRREEAEAKAAKEANDTAEFAAEFEEKRRRDRAAREQESRTGAGTGEAQEEKTSTAESGVADETDDEDVEGDDMTRMRFLKQLYDEIQNASERAGAHATRALRQCHAATAALEEGGIMDADLAWASAGRAVEEATKVANAAKLAGQRAGLVAGILEELTEDGPLAAKRSIENSVGQQVSKATPLEEAARAVADASLSVNEAATDCASVVVDVTGKLRARRCASLCGAGGLRSVDVEEAAQSVKPLAQAARAAAVSAIEAAEACGDALKAAKAARIACQSAPSSTAEVPTAPVDAADAESQQGSADTAPQKEEARRAEEQSRAAEVREATKAWLTVQKTLRRENGEVLELLRQSRAVLRRDPSAIPEVPEDQRTRVFELLAELLDRAALDFHETLLRQDASASTSAVATPSGAPHEPLLSTASVRDAAASALSFLKAADHRIALPVDPRAQVLYAALALDPSSVRAMLEVQLMRRLTGSIAFANSVGGRWGPGLAGNADAEEAVAEIRRELQALTSATIATGGD